MAELNGEKDNVSLEVICLAQISSPWDTEVKSVVLVIQVWAHFSTGAKPCKWKFSSVICFYFLSGI